MMNAVTTSAVITHPLSDHFPIVVQLKCKINRKDEFQPLIRIIKPHKIKKFVEDLNIHLFDANPQKFEDLINCLSNVVNKHFPLTKLSRKQFNFAKKPWMTQEILKSTKHQNKLYKKCQKSGSINDFQTYKSFRNKLTRQKEAAKASFFSTEISKSKNTSTTWKVINNLLRKNKQNSTSSLPSKINTKGHDVFDATSICQELNKYFCSIGHEMAKNVNKRLSNSHIFFGQRVSNTFYLKPTYIDETINIINELNSNTSTGHDGIPAKLIKAAKHSISPFIANIFNAGLENGYFFDELKIARVTPLHKGGTTTDLKNYRPISILSSLNKIFEIIIEERLLKFWDKYNVFVPTQFGFRENYSTSLAIAHLHE